MQCLIMKRDFHHLVSPISGLFSLVRIVLFVQTVSVKIIKMYHSFRKFSHVKIIYTFKHVFTEKENGLRHLRGTFLGL